MNPVVARYLAEKAEPEATFANRFEGSFGHAIEVPAYGETGDLFATLESIPEGPLGEVLTVVVLNARADSSPEVHEANRLARQKIVADSSTAHVLSEAPDVRLLTRPRGKVLLIDRAAPGHFLPTGQGIGLARNRALREDGLIGATRDGKITAIGHESWSGDLPGGKPEATVRSTRVVYAGANKVFRSTDRGATWASATATSPRRSKPRARYSA